MSGTDYKDLMPHDLARAALQYVAQPVNHNVSVYHNVPIIGMSLGPQ